MVEYYCPQLAHQIMVAQGHPEGWQPGVGAFFVSAIPELDDLAIVEVRTETLRPLAEALLLEEQRFWEIVLEGREILLAEWDRLMADPEIARAIEIARSQKRYDTARKMVIDHLRAGGESVFSLSRRVQSRPDYSGIEVPEAFTDTVFAVSLGGQEEPFASVQEAEAFLLDWEPPGKEDLALLERAKEAFKRIAATVGPIRVDNVAVWPRKVHRYKEFCDAHGIAVPRREVETFVLVLLRKT